MRRTSLLIGLAALAAGLVPFMPVVAASKYNPAPQNTYDQGSQFSLTLDGLGQGLLYSPGLSTPSFGAGGTAFIDWRPIHALSFGVGGQYGYFFGSPTFNLETVDVGGRIFPMPADKSVLGELYLQGGVGLNLLVLPPAQGHYHGYAGIGYRVFLSRNLALDTGAQYDFYSPIASASHGAAVKLGLTFLLGRTDWHRSESEEKAEAREMENIQNYQRGSPVYVWRAGDTLRSVAARVFGDPDLYSLLVDANRNLLLHPAQLRPGIQFRVPGLPDSQAALDVYIQRSLHGAAYLKMEKTVERLPYEKQAGWKGPARYKWKTGDDLPIVAEKIYGDPDLYPILVDANEGRLVHPANLKAGVSLIVPAPPVQSWVFTIHEKAWTKDKYMWWKTVSENQFEDKNLGR